MELNSIPEAFQTKLRLMIISALATGQKSFSEIKAVTGATDGNISVQLTNLEKLGYITVTKEFVRKKPLTTCKLTEEGRQGFRDYVNMLSDIVGRAEE